MGRSTFVIYYLLGINISAFLIYGLDKFKAQRQLWRIPEITLLLVALLGGSLGAWLGMKVWRHKSKHLLFAIGLPLILALQLVWIGYLYVLGQGLLG